MLIDVGLPFHRSVYAYPQESTIPVPQQNAPFGLAQHVHGLGALAVPFFLFHFHILSA